MEKRKEPFPNGRENMQVARSTALLLQFLSQVSGE